MRRIVIWVVFSLGIGLLAPSSVRSSTLNAAPGSVLRPQAEPGAKEASREALENALRWLRGLPETTGMVVKDLDPGRFKKMTLDDLRTLRTLVIGGHLKS